LTEESSPATRHTGSCWIDVRDLGRAHVLALLKAQAGGERIIVSAGPFVWQDWRAFLFLFRVFIWLNHFHLS
jgi:nucleoside-diphosphate-sugar epimerase